jgi:hypothetical protein
MGNHIRFLAALEYLELSPKDETRSYTPTLYISNNNNFLIDSYINYKRFKETIGSLFCTLFRKNPYMSVIGDEEEIRNDFNFNNRSIKLITSLTIFVNNITDSLWLIKDNCVNCKICSIYENDNISINTKYTTLTNALSKLTTTSFSFSELENASKLQIELKTILTPLELIPDKDIDIETFNAHSFKNTNRVDRGFNFINAARRSTLLIPKITYYVAALEALFTSSGTEITHKVSERVALFIGENKNQKQEIYQLISKAYKVRSAYIHGGVIPNSKPDLENLSINLDNILRQIILKIIDEKPKPFLLGNSESNLKEFNKYFIDLLFT